ncbi:MAG: ATP-binding protein [Ruminococcus flavefaciens]|nr:ATP-binding protein [Ruminococcus flavefaciens]
MEIKEKKELLFRPEVLVAEQTEIEKALMDEVHMEGLIMRRCSEQDIYYSNAFMVATGKISDDPVAKYYKIQDKVFFKAFAKICQNKHFCTREDCKRNDAIAAEFIIEQNIESRSEYKGIINIEPIKNADESRCGIHYICPLTLLDEIALPVKLYDRPLGVLIVGQISMRENRAALEACIREKLSGSMAENEKRESEDAEDAIRRIKIEDAPERLIEKIFKTVDDIEKELIEHYRERQTRYIFEKSNELINNLKEKIKKADYENKLLKFVFPAIKHIEQYEFIGKCIKEQLEILCDSIGAVKRKIFIPTTNNLVDGRYEEIESEDSVFRLKEWADDNGGKNFFYGNLDKYVDNIGSEFDLLLAAETAAYPIALAVCSEEFLHGITEPERELLKWTVCETFSKFAEYSHMAGMEAKSDYYRVYLDNYMSIQRHELGQSNAGYQMLIEDFIRLRNTIGRRIRDIDLKNKEYGILSEYLRQCDNFIKDSESYLYTTMIRIQSTKYLIDFKDMHKTFFYPYETFLFKWNKIYGIKAQEAGLKFRFPNVNESDYSRPRMYGDPLMIEQVAYNLTNNAIKYALPRTTVSLDCRLNLEQNQYQIIVENIGRPLKDEAEAEKLFAFGQRGSNNRTEGSGLGLFLTRQIADAHDGGVTCETEKLSEFDLTLVHLYIHYFETKKIRTLCSDENLYNRLRQELKEKQSEIEQSITREIKENPFTPMYVNQNIMRGTARFKFTFWIPYQKD